MEDSSGSFVLQASLSKGYLHMEYDVVHGGLFHFVSVCRADREADDGAVDEIPLDDGTLYAQCWVDRSGKL